jgi:hypothetical protein
MFSEYKINFKYKGKRNYVHGSDIHEKTLSSIVENEKDIPTFIRWTFHSPLVRQGLVRVYEYEKVLPVIKGVKARFSMGFENKYLNGFLLERLEKISSSYDYDEADVLIGSKLEGKQISMQCKERYTYVEQIIAMTKLLHQNLYPDIKKWFLTRLSLIPFIDPKPIRGKLLYVRAKKYFNGRLTQNLIEIGDQNAGEIYFSELTKVG